MTYQASKQARRQNSLLTFYGGARPNYCNYNTDQCASCITNEREFDMCIKETLESEDADNC